MRLMVIDLADERAIWRIPTRAVEQIRAVLPDWNVVVVRTAADGRGDGAAAASAEALAAVADAEIYMGWGVSADILEAGRGLRWVHTGTAGVGSSLTPQMRERDLIFTNSAGIHAPPMAESVLGMMLHFARGFDLAVRLQARGEWGRERFDGSDSPVRELAASTVGLVGFGGIGREVAVRALGCGARVLALKRRPAASPQGVELVYGAAGLDRLLGESDYLVLAAPHTPLTSGMIDEAALRRMKRGAVLLNVARGRLVDEAALLVALREGWLRGAGLDTFSVEPLPPEHPFWALDTVLISPHVSAYTHEFWAREVALVLDNLERYCAGRPLRNVVDKAAGY